MTKITRERAPALCLARWGDRTFDQRFWEKVLKTDGCWIWVGSRSTAGYGNIRGARTVLYAHRVSYELHVGPIPAGLFVCHRCDTPACVNPAHLFLGTPADNLHDMATKGRWRGRRGASSPRAAFSWPDVQVIRSRIAAGESRRGIAKEYGVHSTTIANLATRKSYTQPENACV